MSRMTDKEYLNYVEKDVIPSMLDVGSYGVVVDYVKLLQIAREGIELEEYHTSRSPRLRRWGTHSRLKRQR